MILFTFGVLILFIMKKVKILLIFVLLAAIFGLYKYKTNHAKIANIKIASIYTDISNLEVHLEMDKKLNQLEFRANEEISSIILFNDKGEIIKKESPIDNRISLNEIDSHELTISFISSNKMAFKSINF